MVAPRFRSERKKKRLSASASVATTGEPLWMDEIAGGENCCVPIDPIVLVAPVLSIFNPSVVVRLRSTLANLTLNRICATGGGTFTYRRLTIFPSVEAMETARCARVTAF